MKQNAIPTCNLGNMIKVKQKLGLKRSDRVVVSETKNRVVGVEFKQWLKHALIEDAKILDELAMH